MDFNKLRNDPNFHLGLGDVRLTTAMQDEIETEINHIKEQYFSICDLYNELLMAVESKYNGETRHETALKYIGKYEHPREIKSSKDI